MPLSVLTGERSPADPWSSRDRLLAVALTQLDAALCSGCGQPQWVGFDPMVGWEVPDAPLKCHACAARNASAAAWDKTAGEDAAKDRDALRWPVHPHHPDKHSSA